MQNSLNVVLVHQDPRQALKYKQLINKEIQGSRVKLIRNGDEWSGFFRDIISGEESNDVVIFHQGFVRPSEMEFMVEVIRHYQSCARIGIESGGAADWLFKSQFLVDPENARACLEARKSFLDEIQRKYKPDFCFQFSEDTDWFLLQQISRGPISENEKEWRGKFVLTAEAEFYPDGKSVEYRGKERF